MPPLEVSLDALINLRRERTLERLQQGWNFKDIYTKDFFLVSDIEKDMNDFFSELFGDMSLDEIQRLAISRTLPEVE